MRLVKQPQIHAHLYVEYLNRMSYARTCVTTIHLMTLRARVVYCYVSLRYIYDVTKFTR